MTQVVTLQQDTGRGWVILDGVDHWLPYDVLDAIDYLEGYNTREHTQGLVLCRNTLQGLISCHVLEWLQANFPYERPSFFLGLPVTLFAQSPTEFWGAYAYNCLYETLWNEPTTRTFTVPGYTPELVSHKS